MVTAVAVALGSADSAVGQAAAEAVDLEVVVPQAAERAPEGWGLVAAANPPAGEVTVKEVVARSPATPARKVSAGSHVLA